MSGRLRGKVAIVAGAGSIGPGWGNGKATATVFAREGAKVICADINRDAAEETAAFIQNEGGQAFAVEADVTKADQMADLVGRTLGRYGRIDILDNNVGIAEVGGVVELSEEVWDRVFTLNQLTRTTAVQYAPQKIRVNAILPGLMKTPMVEHSAGLAQVYGQGDVAAMWAARDAQVPMGHMGEAWDVAYAALFLASDEARYVTGLEMVVDGGITLKYG
ncbi:MAG: 3-oxoacyl-ACP reductase [Rhizobiales bacterium 32-66-8]|nr:MAG: 3-oxoacyl-ACP reductase [Rhizobiales bacterium 32-66-8]